MQQKVDTVLPRKIADLKKEHKDIETKQLLDTKRKETLDKKNTLLLKEKTTIKASTERLNNIVASSAVQSVKLVDIKEWVGVLDQVIGLNKTRLLQLPVPTQPAKEQIKTQVKTQVDAKEGSTSQATSKTTAVTTADT
jgi:hypothetical protein